MIGLVCIVRDEVERIDAFLDSAQAVCDGPLTIVDTGSVDGTVERVEQRGFSVVRSSWVNFGVNRSEAFELARGTADWLLALDADMIVEVDPDFEPDPAVEAYMIRMGTPDFEYRLPLLLRGDLPWQSVGSCHEYTTLPDRPYVSRPTDKVRVTMTGGDRSSREKSLWHASMLEADLAEHPDDPRTVFYLAQTYWDLRDPRTLSMYERRAKMSGWVEETFYAKYRYALSLPSWPARMIALMAAWEFRPTRLEPLYELVRELNLRDQHRMALQLSQVPVIQPLDHLFVHTGVYRWGMLFERSIAEWWAGDRERAYAMMDDLLAMPDLPEHIREATRRNRGLAEAA